MKQGFLAALRAAAATGVIPDAATLATQGALDTEEGQPHYTDQMRASLEQVRQAPEPSLGTRQQQARYRSRFGGKGEVSGPKGSLAEVLGEVEAQAFQEAKAAVKPPDPHQEELEAVRPGGNGSSREYEPPLPFDTTPLLVGQSEVIPLDRTNSPFDRGVMVQGVSAGPAFPCADDGNCELPTTIEAFPPFANIGGAAGVGKTFWAKTLAERYQEGECVLAATTGIAAVNLGDGTTINALLRFFNTASLREAFTGGFLEAQFKKLRAAGLRRVLLDEKSMLSGDQLTLVTRAIDNVNAERGPDDADLGLFVVGDFAQLPPVQEPFAFESAEWERYAENTFNLTRIRRQDDEAFVQALMAVRRGDSGAALDFFRPRLQSVTLMNYEGPTIVAKNAAVEKYNQLRCDVLKTPSRAFPSQRWGRLRPEWGGDPKPKHEWGVPEVLSLKEGARVMVLANRNIAERGQPPIYAYINGDLGTFLQPEGIGARVRLDRTASEVIVVSVTRENLIPLEPGRRKELKDQGHPERIKEKYEVVGGISYMPLRLAYATTVHKSQGLSLDLVQVNIRDHFFSTPGMLYVALSRARTAEGLRLVGTPEGFRARCTVSSKVKPWL